LWALAFFQVEVKRLENEIDSAKLTLQFEKSIGTTQLSRAQPEQIEPAVTFRLAAVRLIMVIGLATVFGRSYRLFLYQI
tara:strand:+ start:215 stop:451 length:237 start_codon:yes stop_codon:yes gene_type:complete